MASFTPRIESFEHQTEGLKALIANDGVYALLWEPGTGKTKTVIDYLCWLATAARSEVRVLVVCPKVVTDSWVSQTYEFANVEAYADVLCGSINDKAALLANSGPAKIGALPQEPRIAMSIINLETLSSRRQVSKTSSKLHSDLLLDAVKKYSPHVLVVDESHRIKGKSSNASRLMGRLVPHVKRRILLTGTPMPHSPLDVWSQWRVLDPTVFSTNGKSWSFGQFQQHYAIMGGYMGKEIKGFQYLDDLERRMGGSSMVKLKADCLDLPPTTDIMRPFSLSPAEDRAYRKLLSDLLIQLDNGEFMSTPSRITQMLRLRQIVSGYVKADGAEDYTYIGDSRLIAATELLEDLMATESRVVVFAWGRPEVDRLVEKINKSTSLYGAHAAAITGQTSDGERLRLRKNFANIELKDKQILICQWRTVSLGINEFVAASHAVFLSLSQQRDDLIQGKARLDRQGQTKPCTFWFVQCPGTVDEVIMKAHQNRTDLEDALLAHIRSRGGSN